MSNKSEYTTKKHIKLAVNKPPGFLDCGDRSFPGGFFYGVAAMKCDLVDRCLGYTLWWSPLGWYIGTRDFIPSDTTEWRGHAEVSKEWGNLKRMRDLAKNPSSGLQICDISAFPEGAGG